MLKYWLWLACKSGLSCRSILALLRHFASPEDIFFAQEQDYREVDGLHSGDYARLADKDLTRSEQVLADCNKKSIRILTLQDAAYPRRLRNIADPPAVLYYTGTLPQFDAEPAITVVGSRKASAYGLLMAKRIGYQIAACGGLVISGGARGIDTIALQGAISTGKPTVVVLGCGIDVTYPRENAHLFADVAKNGCLISEYPPHTPPERYHFPVRNRIMTGLSVGLVVVEAAEKSGTLISAQHALDQGRDVFAIPGNVGLPSCAGSNRLIKEGAYLAENGWDIMQEYTALFPNRIVDFRGGNTMTLSPAEQSTGPVLTAAETIVQLPAEAPPLTENTPPRKPAAEPDRLAGLTPEERQVVELLQGGSLHIDDLIEEMQLPVPRMMALMTLLEMKHLVRRLPSSRYELE